MKLGTEFQSRSYDAMVNHTTIVFTRYILLEWIRRNRNDQKTYGELFFMLCDDIQDMDLTNALQELMSLFTDMAAMVSADINLNPHARTLGTTINETVQTAGY